MNDDEYTFDNFNLSSSDSVSNITLTSSDSMLSPTVNIGSYTLDSSYTIDTFDTTSLSDYVTTDDLTFDTSSIYGKPANALVDHMPHIDDINRMCEEYPALEKAFEKFRTVYKMVEQDYKGKQKERGLDDEIPF